MKISSVLLLVAPLTLGLSVHAATISTTASLGNPNFPIVDNQGPQSGGTLTSQVEDPGFGSLYIADSFGPATAIATLSNTGSGAVTANGFFALPMMEMSASATWSDTMTNTGAIATGYDFDFTITPAILAAGSNNSTSTAQFAIDILLDGISIFDAGATLEHTFFTSSLTETGSTSLNPTFNLVTDIFGTDVDSYTFDGLESTLSLGTLAPGESLTVEYIMTVMTFHGGEAGAFATVGDPFDINGNPGFSGGIVAAPVPVPAAFWLLISALLPLWLKRK